MMNHQIIDIQHTTHKPTESPTKIPTLHPTNKPTKTPTDKPTKHPTLQPTLHPTQPPTIQWDSIGNTDSARSKQNAVSPKQLKQNEDQLLKEIHSIQKETKQKHKEKPQNTVELYHYPYDSLRVEPEGETPPIFQQHVNDLIREKNHCLIVLPQMESTKPYNISTVKYSRVKFSLMIDIMNDISDGDAFKHKKVFLSKLKKFFLEWQNADSHSKTSNDTVWISENIQQALQTDDDISGDLLDIIFKHINDAFHHAIDYRIKAIQRIFTDTVYGKDGKIQKKHWSDFIMKKQKAINIMEDIAMFLTLSLNYYTFGLKALSLSDAAALPTLHAQITTYFVDLCQFEVSLDIVRIIYEWKKKQKAKYIGTIYVVVARLDLTQDLLSNIGYPKTRIKKLTVTQKDKGYIVSEFITTPTTAPTQPPTSISTETLDALHIFTMDTNDPHYIAKELQIINDKQYKLVIVEHQKALDLSKLKSNRYYIAESAIDQIFERIYSLMISYIDALKDGEYKDINKVIVQTLAHFIDALTLDKSVYFEIMKKLKSQKIHPGFTRIVMTHYLNIQKHGSSAELSVNLDIENKEKIQMIRSIFIFWELCFDHVTAAKLNAMRCTKLRSMNLLRGFTVAMDIYLSLPQHWMSDVVNRSIEQDGGTLERISTLQCDLQAILSKVILTTKFAEVSNIIYDWKSKSFSKHGMVGIVCNAGLINDISLKVLQDIDGYNESSIYFQNVTLKNARTLSSDGVDIIKLYVIDDHNYTRFIDEEIKIADDDTNDLVIVAHVESMDTHIMRRNLSNRYAVRSLTDISFDRTYLMMDTFLSMLSNTGNDVELRGYVIEMLEHYLYQVTLLKSFGDVWMDMFLSTALNAKFKQIIKSHYQQLQKTNSFCRMGKLKPRMIDEAIMVDILRFFSAYFFQITADKLLVIANTMELDQYNDSMKYHHGLSVKLDLYKKTILQFLHGHWMQPVINQGGQGINTLKAELNGIRIELTVLKRLVDVNSVICKWKASGYHGVVAVALRATYSNSLFDNQLIEILEYLGYDEADIQWIRLNKIDDEEVPIKHNDDTKEDMQMVLKAAPYNSLKHSSDMIAFMIIHHQNERQYLNTEYKIASNASFDLVVVQYEEILTISDIKTNRYYRDDNIDYIFKNSFIMIDTFISDIESIKYGQKVKRLILLTVEHFVWYLTMVEKEIFDKIMNTVCMHKLKSIKVFKKTVTEQYKRIKKVGRIQPFNQEGILLMDQHMMRVSFRFIHTYLIMITTTKVATINCILGGSNYGKSKKIPPNVIDTFVTKMQDHLMSLGGNWMDHLITLCIERNEKESLKYIPQIKPMLREVATQIDSFKSWFVTGRIIYDWQSSGHHGVVAITISDTSFIHSTFLYILSGLGYNVTSTQHIYPIATNESRELHHNILSACCNITYIPEFKEEDIIKVYVIDTTAQEKIKYKELEIANDISNALVICRQLNVVDEAQIKSNRYTVHSTIDVVFNLSFAEFQKFIDFDEFAFTTQIKSEILNCIGHFIYYLTWLDTSDMLMKKMLNLTSNQDFREIVYEQYKKVEKAAAFQPMEIQSKTWDTDVMINSLSFMVGYLQLVTAQKLFSAERRVVNSRFYEAKSMPSVVLELLNDLQQMVPSNSWFINIVAECIGGNLGGLRQIISAFRTRFETEKQWLDTLCIIYDWRFQGNHGTVAIITSPAKTDETKMNFLAQIGYNATLIEKMHVHV